MRLFAFAALAAALGGAACAGPEANQAMPVQRITAEAATAVLALPARHGEAVVIEVTRVDNPGRIGVTLVVSAAGNPAPIARLTLFPPDQPARFAVRVPQGVDALQVTLAADPRGRPALVELRAATP